MTGKCGKDLTWHLDTKEGKLSIQGTGAMYDYSKKEPPKWSASMSCVRTLVIGEGVTVIGAYAFSGLVGLKDVSLPKTLQRIGDSAFRECSSLETIVLPKGLKSIGSYAFANCTGLREVK